VVSAHRWLNYRVITDINKRHGYQLTIPNNEIIDVLKQPCKGTYGPTFIDAGVPAGG
jgi:hypothetical protein